MSAKTAKPLTCIACHTPIAPGQRYVATPSADNAYVVVRHAICPASQEPVVRIPIVGTISAQGITRFAQEQPR
jgi:hypothetical protein